MLITETAVHAQTHLAEAKNSVDSISTYPIDSLPKKRSFFGKILNYFNDANKEKKNKKFDFSIIGGPHSSTDTKFGIGLVAAGLYRTDRNDSILPPSNVSLYGILFAGSTWKPSVSPRQIPVELQSVFLFFPKPLLGTRI